MPASEPMRAAEARLALLDVYLREDPANAALLADACETAIAAGDGPRARAYAAAASERGHAGTEWEFRCAHACIVEGDLPGAVRLLDGLLREAPGQPVFLHDRAYVAYLGGDDKRVRELLAPLLNADASGPAQALWLRATHRLGLIDEGWQWVRSQAALPASVYGIASLLAVDADDFAAAQELSEAALREAAPPVEALVARATVAVAEGDAALARRCLEQALRMRANDGRTWATLGLLHLREGDPAQAQRACEKALQSIPQHIGTWHALGWARLLQGDVAGAAQAFDAALALDRNFAESQGAVGLALLLEGRREEAERHLQLAHRLDPHNATGRYARALADGDAGDIQRVQALAIRLLDRPGFSGRKLNEALAARR